ncbi:hypothetical protein CR513_30474, partial [Mucuna pruriens]
MANTTLEDKDDEEVTFNNLKYLQVSYQELLSNSLTLSLGYKELKIKFLKLSKEFKSLEKENKEQTNDLSKVNTLEVNELQKEVIDLRQSLYKFVNGVENLNKFLKYSKSPHDKSSLGFVKEKEIRTNQIFVAQIIESLDVDPMTAESVQKDRPNLQGLTQKDLRKFVYLK